MLNKRFIDELKQSVAEYNQARRAVIKVSDDIRNASKRSIFALHRDDRSTADELLSQAEQQIDEVQGIMEAHRLIEEGSFRSALEEFIEARLYRDYIDGKDLGPVDIKDMEIPYDIYLGGLADTVGELQRRQVRLATVGELAEVRQIKDDIEQVIGELLEMDLTGYLRNKFDQAKNSYRRAEEVLYELSVRRQ